MKDPIPQLQCSKCLKLCNSHNFSMGLLKSILQKNIGFKMQFIRETIKKGKTGYLICKNCKPATFKTLECIKCKCEKTRNEFSIEEKRKLNGYICKDCYEGIYEKYLNEFNREFFNAVCKAPASSLVQSTNVGSYRNNKIMPSTVRVGEASKSGSLSRSAIDKRDNKIQEVTSVNTPDVLYFYEDTKGEFGKVSHRNKNPIHSIADELKSLQISKTFPCYF